MIIKDYILKFVNKPVENILSSQTLYEILFTLINMDKKYNEEKYKKQAKEVAKLICQTQLEDGGFDIGYNFCFGKNMTKKSSKESTTPEILSIYALIKYYDVYQDESVEETIKNGIEWIKSNSYNNGKYWVIPYAPNSYKEVHITNAISFTVATLVYYNYVFKPQEKLINEMCNGMLLYMKDELITINNKGYWNYFEKQLIDKEHYYIKTDNYHIAQQLYYHMEIAKYYDNIDNNQIIKVVSNYLKSKLEENLAVPYIEINSKKTSDIHTWGYASLLLCSLEWKDDKLNKDIIKFMKDNIILNGYIAPIIKEDGTIIDRNYYPRSDAWVLHSFSKYLLYSDDEKLKNIVDEGLLKVNKIKYIGKENHVYTKRKEIFSKCVNKIKGVKNK